VYTTVWVLWDTDFRCFWVTLSCLVISVFAEKKTKKPLKKIKLGVMGFLATWYPIEGNIPDRLSALAELLLCISISCGFGNYSCRSSALNWLKKTSPEWRGTWRWYFAVCRSCLVQYLTTENCCPLCGQLVHKTKPLDYICADKILQDLAYKLIPNLYTSTQFHVSYRPASHALHLSLFPLLFHHFTHPEVPLSFTPGLKLTVTCFTNPITT